MNKDSKDTDRDYLLNNCKDYKTNCRFILLGTLPASSDLYCIYNGELCKQRVLIRYHRYGYRLGIYE